MPTGFPHGAVDTPNRIIPTLQHILPALYGETTPSVEAQLSHSCDI